MAGVPRQRAYGTRTRKGSSVTRKFAWLVSSSVLASPGTRGGVAAHYALPSADLADVAELPGSLVYIVVRDGRKDFMFARVTVNSVDECEDEGENSLGYVLNVDTGTSLRFIVSCDDRDAADYETYDFVGFGLGLSRITDALSAETDAAILRQTKAFVLRYSDRELSRLTPPVARCPSEMAASVLLREIASEFAVSELWGSAHIGNPLANLAAEYLRRHPAFVSDGNIDAAIAVLSTRALLRSTEGPRGLPLVSLAFEPIVSEAIRARRFVARKEDADRAASLQKTEEAERRHQAMLKDIAGYLLICGKRVLQSASVDLAVEDETRFLIFEIKSVNEENAVAQVAKGLFQLLHYTDALERFGRSVSGSGLIVEANLSSETLTAYERVLSRAGVSLFVYDATKEWPNRLFPRLDGKSEA